jgi:hypothetical protein
MFKTLSALALLLANIALFLVAVYVMVLDEQGHSFIFTLLTFLTFPASIWFLAHSINQNLSK